MNHVVTPKRVATALVRGIERAQRDYEKWSLDWLCDAPEYLLTVYAARELAKIADSSFITLEHSARRALQAAGAKRPGRTKAAIRQTGRFDIVIWRPNGTPRAPIELKCQVTRYKQISRDVERVLAAAHHGSATSSIAFGAIAFYTSMKDYKSFSAAERVINFTSNIIQQTEAIVAKTATVTAATLKPTTEDDHAWSATAIVLKPR